MDITESTETDPAFNRVKLYSVPFIDVSNVHTISLAEDLSMIGGLFTAFYAIIFLFTSIFVVKEWQESLYL